MARYGTTDPRGVRDFYSFAGVDGALLDQRRLSRSTLWAMDRPGAEDGHRDCRHDPCVDLRLRVQSIEARLLDHCRRRIEVFHRLAHRYGPDGRRCDSIDCSPDSYVVVAAAFAEEMRSADSELEVLRWLNALLKALDIVSVLADRLSPSVDAPLKAAIEAERVTLDRLHRRMAAPA